MAAFNFPDSPSNGQTYTANNVTYVWNGSAWKKNLSAPDLTITNDLDVDGHANLDNVSIAGVTTFQSPFVRMAPGGGNSGILKLGSANNYQIIALSDKLSLSVSADRSIELSHANSVYLRTSNDGIDITGNLTVSAQPCVQLYTISNVSSFGNSTEATPLEFSDVHINQGGMTLSNNNSRVEVPVSGIYLVNGMASGGNYTTADAGDGVRLQVMRNGSSYPGVKAYGMNSLGSSNNQEFFWSFSIFLNLTATDYLELEFENISTNFGGAITRGQFGVHLLS